MKTRLYDYNNGIEVDYLELTSDQIQLIEFLMKHNYLECEFEVLDDKKFITIKGDDNE